MVTSIFKLHYLTLLQRSSLKNTGYCCSGVERTAVDEVEKFRLLTCPFEEEGVKSATDEIKLIRKCRLFGFRLGGPYCSSCCKHSTNTLECAQWRTQAVASGGSYNMAAPGRGRIGGRKSRAKGRKEGSERPKYTGCACNSTVLVPFDTF